MIPCIGTTREIANYRPGLSVSFNFPVAGKRLQFFDALPILT